MSRRRAAQGLALALLLAAGAGLLLRALRERSLSIRAPRANVVLFSIDTCRADHLSLAGYERKTSPVLDRLAADSVVFERAVSGAPVTAPSHMALLTGLPPTIHGVMNFGRPKDASGGAFTPRLPPSMRTLAEMLRARGYRTGAFTGGGNVNRAFGFDRGFDVYKEGGESGTNGNREAPFDPAKALAFARDARASGAPFFLFVHTYIPHSPYLPPPPYDALYDPGYAGRLPASRDAFFREIGSGTDYQRIDELFWERADPASEADLRHLVALYDGEIHAADDAAAALVTGLEEALSGLDETIVIVTSDHGEQFLEHGEFRHPGEVWDELVRVPLVMRLPATQGGRGVRVGEVASALDLVPTILDLLALPPDPQPLGRSLVRLMEGREDAAAADRFAVSEFVSRSELDARGVAVPREYVRSVRTARAKFVRRFGAAPATALYDLERDPGELRDVAADPAFAGVLRRLEAVSDGFDRLGLERRATAGLAAPSDETMNDLRALGYVR